MPTVLNQTRASAVQLNFLDADVISWQLTKQNENKNEAESVWLGAQVIIGGNAKFRFEDASFYRMVAGALHSLADDRWLLAHYTRFPSFGGGGGSDAMATGAHRSNERFSRTCWYEAGS